MKKRFIENLSLFLVLNLIVKTIYVFGIDMGVQNTVGTDIYGSYFPLFSLVLIFQVFLDLGIENFTRKEIAHNPGLMNRLFSSFLLIKIILVLAFISIFSVIGLLLPHTSGEFKILVLLLINQSMSNFILWLRANVGGLHLFKTEGLISVLDRFFMILIVGSLLLIPLTRNTFKIEWFVIAQTIAYGITLIFSLLVIIRKTDKIKFKFNILPYLPIFRQLWPYALLSLLMAFYYRIDSVFLRYLLPDGREQAGIYAHGFRILDFMSNYALIFALILLPTFSKMLRHKENITSLLRLSSIALIVPSFAFLFSIIFYRNQVFELLYHEHIQISADTFIIFIISFAGICVSYTYGALLTANGNLRQLNIMAITSVAISILLNLILIPRYKVLGAAATNAITQLYTIAFHMIVVNRSFKLKIDFGLIVKFFAFIIFSIGLAYAVSKSALDWYWGIIIATSLSLLFAILIKLLNVSAVKVLFNTKVADQ